jgi:hypothetical protein
MSKKCDNSGVDTWEYTVVEGFFLQDDPKHGEVTEAVRLFPFSSFSPSLELKLIYEAFSIHAQVLPRLGLIDDSPDRWSVFRDKISSTRPSHFDV